jgi:iron complex outermembrane receptor protein
MNRLLPHRLALPLLLCTVALHVHNAYAAGDVAPAMQPVAMVMVSGGRPSSLPMQIATTIESIRETQIAESINAVDSEDVLKYFPSLTIRKRFVGDYDHAVLASRASGTGNSARSLVYADGILLSNLLGNGASYTPRWGLVTPDEIDRVDVLYGPFSAAYPGNSVGAVVDYRTRMPTKLEVHARLTGFSQQFKQYSSNDQYNGKQGSLSVGNKVGRLAWWVSASHLENDGQPIGFATKALSDGVVSNAGAAVTGVVHDRNPANRDWLVLGATNQVHTKQDHIKVKLAYDVTPDLLASYTLGYWKNDVDRSSSTYLKDTHGRPVTFGPINIEGRKYSLSDADFAPAESDLEHVMHGLTLKSHSRGPFNWEIAASIYDYRRDVTRSPTVATDGTGPKAGTITDLHGTGWTTLAAKGTWRPTQHIVEFGVQRDAYSLRTNVSNNSEWHEGAAASRVSEFDGDTRLESVFLQDTWRFAPQWKTTVGGRLERWNAFGGTLANGKTVKRFSDRSETSFSPKFALAHELLETWEVKASVGRAVRYPTVAELYQGAIVEDTVINNDPNLKPEKSWTTELSLEHQLNNGLIRTTVFREESKDALYSQRNVTVTPNVTNIQNVQRIGTIGAEFAGQFANVLPNFDLNTSATYASSTIDANTNFPGSVGKRQPRVPKWRANVLGTYRPIDTWSVTLGARFSGRQFGTLDNSDINANTYTAFSSFLVADLRVRHQFDKQWSAALGIDNIGNKKYWAYHPYTQRTLLAELQYDLR